MAFLGIAIPHDTARLLHTIEVPGDRVDVSTMHVTILYLGNDVPIQELGRAIVAAYDVVSRHRSFLLKSRKVTSFGPGDYGYPIVCRVESPELHELRTQLRTAFDEVGVEYSDKYPTYKPHVTLSYSEEQMADKAFPHLEWAANELTLWGGDQGDDRLSCTFPFSLRPSQERTTRALIGLAARKNKRRVA